MNTLRIEVIKPIIEDRTPNQINFGCSRNDGGPIITEIDLKFTKIGLRSVVILKNFSKNYFQRLNSP